MNSDNTPSNRPIRASTGLKKKRGQRIRAESKPGTAAYIRVSTVGQNLAGQKAEVERWLIGKGIKDVRWFIDKKTGDHLDRPAFEKLQRAVFNGEIDTIVVYKLDRLSRKLVEGLNTLAAWCEAGIRVVSTSQQLDFNGATGRLIAAVLFAVSEMEQETRRERQAIGIREAKRKGVYKGRKAGTLKASPARAYELRQKGMTNEEIGKFLGVSSVTISKYIQLYKRA